MTTDVARVQREQFEKACKTDLKYMHATWADDYRFGSLNKSGLNVLTLVQVLDEATVLDIGAGHGTFLRLLPHDGERNLRLVGLTAKERQSHKDRNDSIEWVYGDFQRPDTWRPSDILTDESVDLAVASLTFQHFVDPIGAVRNAMKLLRPNGHLLIDRICIDIDPDKSGEVSSIIENGFTSNLGEWDGAVVINDAKITCHNLHLQKTGEIPFDGIVPYAIDDNIGLAYTLE